MARLEIPHSALRLPPWEPGGAYDLWNLRKVLIDLPRKLFTFDTFARIQVNDGQTRLVVGKQFEGLLQIMRVDSLVTALSQQCCHIQCMD